MDGWIDGELASWMSICLALEVPGKCVNEKNAFLIMHCVLQPLATKRGDLLYEYICKMHKNAFLFLCIVRLCKGCLCVWAQRTPLIVYISTSSRILILEYIFGAGFHSSALLSMHAHALHFYSARVCECVVCLLHFSLCKKLHTIFLLCFISGTFFSKCIQRNCTFHFVHLLCALQA